MELEGLKWGLPVLILFVGLEAIVRRLVGRPAQDGKEILATLAVAGLQRAAGLFLIGLIFGAYQQIYALVPWHWEMDRPIHFLALFLLSDLHYYLFHRFSHWCRWLWATHGVHHSSNQMNFAAALRLGWTGRLSGVPVLFLPLIFLGVPPRAVALATGVNLLYQFWLHTELIPKLGPLEWIFNTPSHHRVHHGSNSAYLDKNFGGVLIVFDRWFGTFAEEKEAVRYGLVEPLRSYNPLEISLHEWKAMYGDVKRAKGVKEKARCLMKAPASNGPAEPGAPRSGFPRKT
jgi:sterol desaturase/sphingolipid hydroxylase (fatty acid hydroxylase superfamily)